MRQPAEYRPLNSRRWHGDPRGHGEGQGNGAGSGEHSPHRLTFGWAAPAVGCAAGIEPFTHGGQHVVTERPRRWWCEHGDACLERGIVATLRQATTVGRGMVVVRHGGGHGEQSCSKAIVGRGKCFGITGCQSLCERCHNLRPPMKPTRLPRSLPLRPKGATASQILSTVFFELAEA